MPFDNYNQATTFGSDMGDANGSKGRAKGEEKWWSFIERLATKWGAVNNWTTGTNTSRLIPIWRCFVGDSINTVFCVTN